MDLVDIEEYKNYMFDRNLNQVYNIKTKKHLKNRLDKGNYFVGLFKDGKQKTFRLNQMIYKYNNQDDPDDFVDIDDYENYKFNKNLNQVINIKSGKYLKNYIDSNGYYNICLSKNGTDKQFKLHRLVYQAHNPLINIEGFEIDHKDHNKLNNNIDNLRIATSSENNCNRKINKKNKSTGIKNISKNKNNTFTVQIRKDEKKYSKTFKSLEEAIIWRDIKLKEIHKEFACYN